MTAEITFRMRLFDDASVREKLTVMGPVEAMFDDERNPVPDEYYDIVSVKPGEGVEITVRRLPCINGEANANPGAD